MGFLTTIGGKVLLGLGLVAAILFFLLLVQNKMGCQSARQKARDERRDERAKRSKECKLADVLSGCQIEVLWTRRKTLVVDLVGIEIPAAVADEAADNLSELTVRGKVRVDYEFHRLFSANEGDEQLDEAEVMAAAPISGLVYGDGNLCLQIEQLKAGLAKCNSDATDEMKAAEKKAMKNKAGLWK